MQKLTILGLDYWLIGSDEWDAECDRVKKRIDEAKTNGNADVVTGLRRLLQEEKDRSYRLSQERHAARQRECELGTQVGQLKREADANKGIIKYWNALFREADGKAERLQVVLLTTEAQVEDLKCGIKDLEEKAKAAPVIRLGDLEKENQAFAGRINELSTGLASLMKLAGVNQGYSTGEAFDRITVEIRKKDALADQLHDDLIACQQDRDRWIILTEETEKDVDGLFLQLDRERAQRAAERSGIYAKLEGAQRQLHAATCVINDVKEAKNVVDCIRKWLDIVVPDKEKTNES